MDPERPHATAAVIRDGRFAWVGDDADVDRALDAVEGPHSGRARRMDLGGRRVLPGLIDAHTHPGLVTGSKDVFLLRRSHDLAEILAAVAREVRETPGTGLLKGGYFPIELFGLTGPRRETLDQATGDRPVVLYDDSGHSQWCNTAALELLGINEQTQDPAPGMSVYVRDPDGRPTGWTKEFALQPLLRGLRSGPMQPPAELEEFLRYLVSRGVVALLDGGSQDAEPVVYEALAEMERQGRLPLRYEGAVHVTLPEQVATAPDVLLDLRARFGGERLRFNTVKLVFDGVTEVGTAAMLDPYLDPRAGRGATLLDGAAFEQLVLRMHAIGANLHLHTVGDAAVRTALDAVERAQAIVGGRDNLRTIVSLSHIEVVHPDDIERFARLGVIANFTPHWYGGYFEGAEPWLGTDRYRRMYQVRSLLDAGAVVACSSDITDHVEWTSGRADPFLGMEIGHRRLEPADADAEEAEAPAADAEDARAPRSPADERVPLEALIRGYTLAAAQQMGIDGDHGTIAPGRRASLVVLDRDILEIPPAQIHAVNPAAVLVDGELVAGSLD